MKKIFLIFSFIVTNFFCNNNFCVAYAQIDSKPSNKFSYMYDYGVTTPVNKETKVYIDESMVDFIKNTNREVFEETKTVFFIPQKRYYYIANEYVEKVVSVRQISNDVDSLIFMLRELESEAIKYDSIHYKNIVLGYIRSINSDYDGDSYYGKWDAISGTIPFDFIQKIDNDYSHGLRFCDYFGSFINYSNYNSKSHLDMLTKYKRFHERLDLIDNNGNNLDLIHMFAAIDAIYDDTGNSLTIGRNNLQRDIASWNGDLQQACEYLKYKETENEDFIESIDFSKDILGISDSGCGIEDIIGDIDAMNITKSYINYAENSISNAVSAYYSLIHENKSFRYQMFVNSVILDEENHIDSDSKIERFEHEVYYEFNIKKENGTITNCENYLPIEQVHYLMKGNSISINNSKMPSLEVREFITYGFINFVLNNINSN